MVQYAYMIHLLICECRTGLVLNETLKSFEGAQSFNEIEFKVVS